MDFLKFGGREQIHRYYKYRMKFLKFVESTLIVIEVSFL